MSLGETELGLLLRQEFKQYKILPQYTIKEQGHTLFLDWYIPALKIAAEADGRQHSEYVGFFHGTRANFEKSKKLDRIKDEWCRKNGVTMIRFKHTESITKATLRVKVRDAVASLHGEQEENN